MYIIMNERISCIHYVLCGAVVALQFKEFGLWVLALEIEYIAYIRATEGVY